MQTVEGILSLLFFISILLLLVPEVKPIDYSLYQLQLADDVWRILYLRGNFNDFADAKRVIIELDMAKIGDQTGLCFFIDGIQFTNCRSGDNHVILITLKRTVISAGSPRQVTFSIASR
ncbi:MAG: hypothetical protein ABID61_04085 [Candidatus Micrarchaeota archaeon]